MIKLIEELSINAVPALNTLIYDGWLLRFSKGFSKRSNSINPLYQSELNIEEKILRCEKIYHSKQLPVIFKLTKDCIPQNLDEILENKGYTYIDPVSVQLLDLNKSIPPNNTNISIYNSADRRWLEDYFHVNDINSDSISTIQLMLENIFPEKYFITLKRKDKAVACGVAVLEKEFIGLFNIIVAKDFRGQGYGEQTLLNLLNIGVEKKAKFAYLQVCKDNIPAIHMYRKYSFKEIYQYWYRAKL